MIPLAPYLVILLIAVMVVIASTRWRFPYTVALVIFGIALGLVTEKVDLPAIIGGASSLFTPDLFFYILLPPIVFEAALHVNYRHLKARAPLVLFLIFVGVVFTTFFTAFLVSSLIAIPLAVALLIAAILSPTDPVAVIDLLRRLKVPPELSTIVESESLLNDAVGIMLFAVVLQYVESGVVHPLYSVLYFLWLGGAGVAIGLLVAGVVYVMHRRLNDPAVETALSVVVAFGSFFVAQYIGASGIVATAIAGIAVGTWVAPSAMGPESRYSLATFWKVVVYVSISMIFLSMGLIIAISNILQYLGPILLLLTALFLGRALFVYAHRPLSRVLNAGRTRLPGEWYNVITLSGIRGAIPVALAFSLLTLGTRLTTGTLQMIVSSVVGVAILSVILGNLASEWYVRKHFVV